MLTWWVMWRVPVLVLIVMSLWWFVFRPIASERGWVPISQEFAICGERSAAPAQACIIDGDTVAIGFGREGRRIRLTGFDAPELEGACDAESELAVTARTALHDWLAQGTFEWNGADEPPYDRYGRELRSVRRNAEGRQEYLAEWMIAQGLAAESGWGVEPKDWCEG
jgi:endonuclease YncB( thermonuclease family)